MVRVTDLAVEIGQQRLVLGDLGGEGLQPAAPVFVVTAPFPLPPQTRGRYRCVPVVQQFAVGFDQVTEAPAISSDVM
jgi:hypothetical protein